MPNIAAGTQQTRYQIEEIIGQGGMGVVYRAFDRLRGEEVALKQVTVPEHRVIQSCSSSFLPVALAQEFKVMASLRHLNIVSVLDYGFDQNAVPYYTMEYFENALPITEAVNSTDDVEVMVDWLIQGLKALAYLHRRGVLHRDLKPANVLVNERGHVKLLDFGVSVVDQRLQAEDDRLFGTPAYLAPEVLRGEAYTHRSDLYAIGLIAFEVLAGQPPYEKSNLTSLLVQALNQPIDTQRLPVNDALK
ncbi:MAG: serine/threonine protein kinase, partial [Chloroflexi bacterium]|nr:serine/threonine protein kinase [Chloroflexota bacterium]